MTWSKRLFDLAAALFLTVLLFPLIVILTLVILIREGRPVLYISERMKTADDPFQLWKYRTMTVAEQDSGVSGGDKAARITPTGAFLRRYRLDEIPQLWNILRGDISFVGPRPPLRRYVEMFPDLYRKVLHSRPGITGLATILFHRHEENILADCQTPKETESAYVRRCVPRKAALDLIYQSRRNLCLDIALMIKTVFRKFPLK
ncbi:putative sugar transferase EpsL [Thalassovita gelatinovora]|uniref:Putative sugar transferase EpsL n=1 Tax=Thalassovita gelatinovora TaxID=53501 RepID=A0A0N7LUY9_THAGE|nr:sugar transferase [Thalassovita gelatinovora]CUH64826.1 putative sugar transferase EpsL [Thalassovita gelatinovora]SEP91399.1 Sugar transferase involved in LPS biosynthesis (colanic, teichoic acid) [Thalassovita gelatinovora]